MSPSAYPSGPSFEVLPPIDDRLEIKNALQEPYKWICSIEARFDYPVYNALGILENPGSTLERLSKSAYGCGTGLLLSHRHVLTAGHVLCGLTICRDRRAGRKMIAPLMASSVVVIPGRNEEDASYPKPFGAYRHKRLSIHSKFRNAFITDLQNLTPGHILKALPFDYGLIELTDNPLKVGNTTGKPGWWGNQTGFKIDAVEGQYRRRLHNAKVNVCGYPTNEKSHKCGKGRYSCGALYIAGGLVADAFPKINDKTTDLLLHRADTCAGQSGSPIWLKNKGGARSLVGIHSSFAEFFNQRTGKFEKVNLGVLLTPRVLEQLAAWNKSL